METKNNTNRKVLIRSQILDSGTFEIDKGLNVEDEDFEEYVGQTLLLDGIPYPDLRVTDVESDKVTRGLIYKDKSGSLHLGRYVPDGTQSVLLHYDQEQRTDSRFYLSCSVKETKRLWNKGDIEELQSYHINYQVEPDPLSLTISYDSHQYPDSFLEFYKMRESKSLLIHVQDRERFQKDSDFGECEKLVNSIL